MTGQSESRFLSINSAATDQWQQSWTHEASGRYYRVRVQSDLFGRHSLVTSWGSLDGSDAAGVMDTNLAADQVIERMSRISARRRRLGYRLRT